MSVRSVIVSQFKQPRGLLGSVAGFIMAHRRSNRQRNEWTVAMLELDPKLRVLEVGPGPGLALKACASKLPEGLAVGVDHSQVMVSQARARLAEEISAGRAEVLLGSLSDISGVGNSRYDRVFSLNVIQFVSDMSEAYRQIFGLLACGGMAASTYQPRSKNPARKNSVRMAVRIEAAMKVAGFVRIERHELPLDPAPAICVTGWKP